MYGLYQFLGDSSVWVISVSVIGLKLGYISVLSYVVVAPISVSG